MSAEPESPRLQGAATLAHGEHSLRRRLLSVLVGETEPRGVSYDEFLAWAHEDTLAEWVGGEVVMSSPASRQHQSLADFLLRILGAYADAHRLGEVVSAPFQMKLADSGREPDLLFIAAEHRDRLRETHLEGPADLVVEIVSPESIGPDRGEKFAEYESGGVREYWLIDPQRRCVELYLLEAGRYRLDFAGGQGKFSSAVLPGFWLQAEWLWREPLPPVEDVILQVAGKAYAQRWIDRLRAAGFLAKDAE